MCHRANAAARDAERAKVERRLRTKLAAANDEVVSKTARVAELETRVLEHEHMQNDLEAKLADAAQRAESAHAEAAAAAATIARLRAGDGSGELLRASKSGRRAMVALARAEKQLVSHPIHSRAQFVC